MSRFFAFVLAFVVDNVLLSLLVVLAVVLGVYAARELWKIRHLAIAFALLSGS